MTTEYRFDDRVAIVTGAGGGLGKAYASLLAQRGAKVLVNDLGGNFFGEGSDANYAEASAREIREQGGEAVANAQSVATSDGAKAIVADAMAQWGRVDIVINNAGVVSSSTPLDTLTDENWITDVGVPAGGTFNLCREVWGEMRRNDYGRIVNICSGSWFGMGTAVPYPAAKGAVWGISRSLGKTAAHNGWNINVNSIMPIAGTRMTELMGEDINARMQKNFPPDSVAPVVAMLVHDDAPCNGEMFTVGGGGYGRVFAGVTTGYVNADDKNKSWSLEEAFAAFDTAFNTEEFEIPEDAMGEAAMHTTTIPWASFREFIK